MRSPEGLRADADGWKQALRGQSGRETAALGYARVLTALDQKAQAVAVLQAAAVKVAKDQEILAAYGKALVDTGGYSQAPKCWRAPIRPTGPIGASSRRRASPQTASELHDRAQSALSRGAEDRAGRAGGHVQSRALLCLVEEAAGGRTGADRRLRATPRRIRGCARTSHWCWALQGRFDTATQTLRRDLSPGRRSDQRR